MYTLDIDVFGSILLPRAGLDHAPFTLSPRTKTKPITPDFGAADATARIIERTITLGPGVMNVQLKLSRTAGLLTWLSDSGVQVGALLDLEPALEHTFTLRFNPSPRDRFLRLNLEVVN